MWPGSAVVCCVRQLLVLAHSPAKYAALHCRTLLETPVMTVITCCGCFTHSCALPVLIGDCFKGFPSSLPVAGRLQV